jgi:hypothetical protein
MVKFPPLRVEVYAVADTVVRHGSLYQCGDCPPKPGQICVRFDECYEREDQWIQDPGLRGLEVLHPPTVITL